jgi:hypothetical protein
MSAGGSAQAWPQVHAEAKLGVDTYTHEE